MKGQEKKQKRAEVKGHIVVKANKTHNGQAPFWYLMVSWIKQQIKTRTCWELLGQPGLNIIRATINLSV